MTADDSESKRNHKSQDLALTLSGTSQHSGILPWPPGSILDALGQGIFSITVSVRTIARLYFSPQLL